jgi:hypothetical protein
MYFSYSTWMQYKEDLRKFQYTPVVDLFLHIVHSSTVFVPKEHFLLAGGENITLFRRRIQVENTWLIINKQRA